jgi:SNF2 family DNA or RNA helicase
MFYDADKNVVIYDNPPAPVLAFAGGLLRPVPGLDNHHYCKATLENLQTLRMFDVDVPPIMNFRYDWPRLRRAIPKPFAAQVVTANHVALHPRSFVLNDMRTGKTLSCLWAAEFIMQEAERKGLTVRCLIICPLSTVRSVWVDAIQTHFMGRRKVTNAYNSSAKRRMQLLQSSSDFYVMNLDGIKIGAKKTWRGVDLEKGGLAAHIRDRADIQIIIIDEASGFRDAQSARSKAAQTVLAEKEYVWALTGTPTPNAPTDAHGLRKLIDPEYRESFKSVKERMMYHVGGFKWSPRPDGYIQAAELLQPAVRFRKSDCFDLPPQLQTARDAEFTAEQAELYEALRLAMRAELAGGEIDAVHEGALRLKLLQIACGAVYDGAHVAHEVDCSGRLDVLKEAMDEADCGPKGEGKCLIFAPFTSTVNLLRKHLDDWFRKGGAAAGTIRQITGSVTPKERAEIVSKFQSADAPRVIIADPGTMAHGLTCTAANTIIWYAPTDKPENWAQGNERILGASQKNTTLVVKIAITKVEREIYDRLNNKQSMQGAMLSMLEDR